MLPYIWHLTWLNVPQEFFPIQLEQPDNKPGQTCNSLPRRRQRVWSKSKSEMLYKLCKERSLYTGTPLEELTLENLTDIAKELERAPDQCLIKLRLILSCGSLKAGIWSQAEDNRLLELMEGGKRWCEIAKCLNLEIHRTIKVRNGKQCKERWKNHLNPELNHGPWGVLEDIQLLRCVQKHGLEWRRIKMEIPERTENSIKNRLKSLLNKKWQEVRTFGAKASLERTVEELITALSLNLDGKTSQ